jgi:hypothetical protein
MPSLTNKMKQIICGETPLCITKQTTIKMANHLNSRNNEFILNIFISEKFKNYYYVCIQTIISLGDSQFRALSCKVFGKNTTRPQGRCGDYFQNP